MSPDHTLVFDLDGTLVDTAPDLVGATNHVLAGLALPPRQAHELRPWISHGARRMIVEALAQSRRAATDPEIDALLVPFLQYYQSNIARESRPFPGVVDQIAALKQAGARIAICTNKRHALSLQLLDALQITGLFDAVVGRDTLAVSKPHPDHLLQAIIRAGGERTRAVMIGDSDVDVATARAAGVPVIGVTFGYSAIPMHALQPDVLLHDYAELPAGLGQIFPSI